MESPGRSKMAEASVCDARQVAGVQALAIQVEVVGLMSVHGMVEQFALHFMHGFLLPDFPGVGLWRNSRGRP